jgi:hypothetical protein
MLPFSYASISAIIGTQSVLLAKSISELLRTTADGRQQFGAYFTYVILAAWLSSILFWMYRMTTALRKFDKEPLIIPVLQVVWTIFSIVGGGIYFEEFRKMNSTAIALFTLGVLMLLVGVYLLTPHQPAHAQHPSALAQQHHQLQMMQMAAQQNGHHHMGMHLSDVELAMDGHHHHDMHHHHYGMHQAVGHMAGSSELALAVAQANGVALGMGMGGTSLSPPGDALYGHGHSSDGGHSTSSSGSSHSKGGKDDVPAPRSARGPSGAASPGGLAGDASLAPPGRITRVTSTGRTIIQSSLPPSNPITPPLEVSGGSQSRSAGGGSAGGSSEVSPDFRPFEGAVASPQLPAVGTASSRAHAQHHLHPLAHEHDALTDDAHLRSSGGNLSLDLDPMGSAIADNNHKHAQLAMERLHAAAIYHSRAAAASAAYAAGSTSSSGGGPGILSEAGLLGSGLGRHHHNHTNSLSTPPLRPSPANWSTPPHHTRTGGMLDSRDSRPTSAHGLMSDGLGGSSSIGGHSGSIPPSPALYGYDPFASLRQEGAVVKRSRGMSLGFSMPMADMDDNTQ